MTKNINITKGTKEKELYMEVEYSTLVAIEDDEISWASIGLVEAEYEGKIIMIDFDECSTSKLGKGDGGEQILCYSNRSRHITEDFKGQYEELGLDMNGIEAEKLASTSEIEEVHWEVFRNDNEDDFIPIMVNSIRFADEGHASTGVCYNVSQQAIDNLNARLFKDMIEGMSHAWLKKELFDRGFECMVVAFQKGKTPMASLFIGEEEEDKFQEFTEEVSKIKGLMRTKGDVMKRVEKLRKAGVEGSYLFLI